MTMTWDKFICGHQGCEHSGKRLHVHLEDVDAAVLANRRPGAAERDEALERVERNAEDKVLYYVTQALDLVIMRGKSFTTDDVWKVLHEERPDLIVREPRVMGAVIRAAAKTGSIVRSNETRDSDRPESHRRPCRVWWPV